MPSLNPFPKCYSSGHSMLTNITKGEDESCVLVYIKLEEEQELHGIPCQDELLHRVQDARDTNLCWIPVYKVLSEARISEVFSVSEEQNPLKEATIPLKSNKSPDRGSTLTFYYESMYLWSRSSVHEFFIFYLLKRKLLLCACMYNWLLWFSKFLLYIVHFTLILYHVNIM